MFGQIKLKCNNSNFKVEICIINTFMKHKNTFCFPLGQSNMCVERAVMDFNRLETTGTNWNGKDGKCLDIDGNEVF